MLAAVIDIRVETVDSPDYRNYLATIITNCEAILAEVKNHQTTTDLSPVTSQLDRIVRTMSEIAGNQAIGNEMLKTISSSLITQFHSLVSSIDDFRSDMLDTIDALGKGLATAFEKSLADTESLLEQTIAAVRDGAVSKTRSLFSYGAIVLADAAHSAIVTIPAGATEISVIPRTKFDYKVNARTYDPGLAYLREFRTIQNTAIIEPLTKIELPAGARVHISYTALNDIGELTVENATTLAPDASDEDIQTLIDRGISALDRVEADEEERKGRAPRKKQDD